MKDYNLFHHAVCIVAESNMASKKEIAESISDIKSIIGTEYYDDPDCDQLLNHVIDFLNRKLNKS